MQREHVNGRTKGAGARRRERKETLVQTHVGSNRRRTVLHSRKQGRAFSCIRSFAFVDRLTRIRIYTF